MHFLRSEVTLEHSEEEKISFLIMGPDIDAREFIRTPLGHAIWVASIDLGIHLLPRLPVPVEPVDHDPNELLRQLYEATGVDPNSEKAIYVD